MFSSGSNHTPVRICELLSLHSCPLVLYQLTLHPYMPFPYSLYPPRHPEHGFGTDLDLPMHCAPAASEGTPSVLVFDRLSLPCRPVHEHNTCRVSNPFDARITSNVRITRIPRMTTHHQQPFVTSPVRLGAFTGISGCLLGPCLIIDVVLLEPILLASSASEKSPE